MLLFRIVNFDLHIEIFGEILYKGEFSFEHFFNTFMETKTSITQLFLYQMPL